MAHKLASCWANYENWMELSWFCWIQSALTRMMSAPGNGCSIIGRNQESARKPSKFSRNQASTFFYQAPVLVLVSAHSPALQASEDCCLAAQNLMLATRDKAIGSCWIGFARPWLNLAATKKELGLPEAYCVVAPVVLGYPSAWPQSHGRKAAEIHWL